MNRYIPFHRKTLPVLVFLVFANGSLLLSQEASQLESGNEYYPIDLPAALRLANAQNLDIKITRQKLAEARANQERAVFQFFPWLAVGGSYDAHNDLLQVSRGSIIDVEKQNFTVGPALNLHLELGDAIYNALAAKKLVTGAGHALEAQEQDSALLAAQGYFNLLKTQIGVGIAKDALRISQDHYQQIQSAVEAGIAFKGDEFRVKVQLKRNQMALRQALEQQRIASARLAQILHLQPSVELVAKDTDLSMLTIVATDISLDSLVKQALVSRPELNESQAIILAAKDAKKGVVNGQLIPRVGVHTFAGGLGGDSNESPSRFGATENFGVTLYWRIGPGGLFDSGRKHDAQSRLERVKLIREKLEDEISRQVIESATRVRSLADQIEMVRSALRSAEETLRLTQQRREFGIGAVLERIQAEGELTGTRLDYSNALAEYNKAQYALSKAIGIIPISAGPQNKKPHKEAEE